MHIKLFKPALSLICALSVIAAQAAYADNAPDTSTVNALWEKANIYGGVRYRYEFVDQDGLPRNANASTARARLGLDSGEFAGLSFKIEGEAVLHAGREKYNDTLNGRTAFPVVADPEDLLLNQAYLRWHHAKTIDVKAGRQTINLDNQRWIGSVGWRQNDQTFDAGFATSSPIEGLTLQYSYAWRVNRIFGPDSLQGIWRDNDIHLLRAAYDVEGFGTLVSYGYLLDIPNAPLASSKTFGARFSGKHAFNDKVSLLYAIEYAHQTEHGDNTRDFGLSYTLIEPGIAFGPVTARFGYERLGGNGQTGLQTPLATLHAFGGWADQFLNTPANGLEDFYGDVIFKLSGAKWLDGMVIRAVYHDFSSARAGLEYGHEFDALISRKINKYLTLSAKYANYQSDGFSTDTEKLWFTIDAAF